MRLNQAWIAYCAFMSAVNAYVVMNFSTEFWVDFKLWGYAFPRVPGGSRSLHRAPYQGRRTRPLRIPLPTPHHVPIAEQMHRQLAQTLSTTALEVIDESAAHAGHAGSNGTDFGTHFRVRIASPSLQASRAWPSTALCMMRCRNLLTRASTHSPLKFSEAVCSFW